MATPIKRRLAVAVAAGACVAGFAASAAQAAIDDPFTFAAPYAGKCSGASIVGNGSTFQNTFNSVAKSGYEGTYCKAKKYTDASQSSFGTFDPLSVTPSLPKKSITYNPAGPPTVTGSGRGIASLGGNTTVAPDAPNSTHQRDFYGIGARFAGTDDAPTTATIADINAGDGVTGIGVVRTIPVISGAIALVMNYPHGCTIPDAFKWKPGVAPGDPGADSPASYPNKYRYPEGTTRIKLSRQAIEKFFRGGAGFNHWGDLISGISGTTTDPVVGGSVDCASANILRVVRSDVSGSTVAFKRYLDDIKPTIHYREDDSPVVFGNTQWPNGAVNLDPQNGGGALGTEVAAKSGSIGYVDLATARSRGFDSSYTAGGQDYTFMVPLPDRNASIKEPTFSPEAYKSIRAAGTIPQGSAAIADPGFNLPPAASPGLQKRGANCRSTVYSQVAPGGAVSALPGGGNGPEDSRISWFSVSGVASTTDYPDCTLSYDLVWDDSFNVFGNPGTTNLELARQRTVSDYELYKLSNTGQNLGDTSDYSRVPDSILVNVSRKAQQAIGFQKP